MIRSEPTYHPQVPAMSDEGEVELSSPEPCGQSWADMPGDDHKRFCGSCQHHVHNLSAMTAREAYALIKARRAGERLCVRYLVEDDQVVFREDEAAARQLSRQLDGLRRMAAVALVAVPLLTACEPVATSNEHAEAQAPLVIRDGQPVMLSPGAAARPLRQSNSHPRSKRLTAGALSCARTCLNESAGAMSCARNKQSVIVCMRSGGRA